MSIHEGPVTAPTTRPYQEPDALLSVAPDGVTLPPVWPHWITLSAASLGIDPALIYAIWLDGRRDGWQLGYDARDAQLSEGAYEDARKVATWVAKDLRRKPASDLDLEAYRLWQRVHPELVTT